MDEWKTERDPLMAGTEKNKVESDDLAICTREVEVDAEMRDA